MDSEEIDDKISELGTETFSSRTKEWLKSILMQHHFKEPVKSITDDKATAPADIKSMTDEFDLPQGTCTQNETSTSSSIMVPTSQTQNSKQAQSGQANSLNLLLYTIGHIVSNQTLLIPSQTTILCFNVTYALKPNGKEKDEILHKNLIVKLIDDEIYGLDGNDGSKVNIGNGDGNNGKDDVDGGSAAADAAFDDHCNSALCEYNFYQRIVPEIEAWALSRGFPFKFGVPSCLYGKYIPGTNSRKSSLLLDSLSVLVLENLVEDQGYSMYDPGPEGLSVDDLKVGIVEISRIHAVSWAYQECIGEPLEQHFKNYFEDLEEEAENFKDDIEDSTSDLITFLEEKGTAVALSLLEKLKTRLLPNIEQHIRRLLIPTDSIKPIKCLVHFDFWHQNILFQAQAVEEGNLAEQGALALKKCRILDWDKLNVGQPMIDVASLLFRSASPSVRRQHLDEIIEVYTSTFKATAQSLNVPTVLDVSYFTAQYKKCALFPILMIMATMSLAICDDITMDLFMEGLIDLDADGIL